MNLRKLISTVSTVCATTLTVSAAAQLSLPNAARSSPRQCIPIAYVLSNAAWGFNIGDSVCVGDLIVLRSHQPLLVQCYGVGWVKLSAGRVPPSGCGIAQESPPLAVSGGSNFTVAPRGSNQATLRILAPSGRTSTTRPQFSWQSVPKATSYRIWVFGSVSWSTVTNRTQLSYPSRQPAFQVGNAYRIVVGAYRGEQLLLIGEQAINVDRSKVSQAKTSVWTF